MTVAPDAFGRRNALRAIGASMIAACLPGALPALAQDTKSNLEDELPTVPYVPTPQEVVDKMLEMAKVTKADTVYDLGCGDGRIVITAAKRYGAKGVGIDLSPERIREANENRKAEGVEDRVQFEQGDLFDADFSKATVVTLYLLPQVNVALRSQLWRQLAPGTRVVSHAFDMGPEWPPERTEMVDGRVIYFWTIRPEHKKKVA